MDRYNPTADEEKSHRSRMKLDTARMLRKIRRRKNMTQERVAELAGINPKYLGEIERGLKSPTVVVVRRLADALSVPVCVILAAGPCPCAEGRSREVAALLSGKHEQKIAKVMKLIELLFE